MKIIFMWLMLSQLAYANLDPDGIIVETSNGQTKQYSSKEYEVVKKVKDKIHPSDHIPINYSKRKYLLKGNTLSFYMGRGPINIGKMENTYDGSTKYYMNYGNIYGVGLSQRLGDTFHLEMLATSNDTMLSGFKVEF